MAGRQTDRQNLLADLFPVWDKLSSEQQDAMCAATSLQSFEAGSHIHGLGRDCMGVIFVVTGKLRVFLLGEDGREITLFHLSNGEACIMSASCALSIMPFDIFIDADTDVDLLITLPNTYDALVKDNLACEAYSYKQIVQRLSQVMKVMEAYLFVPLDRRVATYLVKQSDASGHIHKTHETIAKDLGSAREVVSRMLKSFEHEELVQLSRGSIQITEAERLAAKAVSSELH